MNDISILFHIMRHILQVTSLLWLPAFIFFLSEKHAAVLVEVIPERQPVSVWIRFVITAGVGAFVGLSICSGCTGYGTCLIVFFHLFDISLIIVEYARLRYSQFIQEAVQHHPSNSSHVSHLHHPNYARYMQVWSMDARLEQITNVRQVMSNQILESYWVTRHMQASHLFTSRWL